MQKFALALAAAAVVALAGPATAQDYRIAYGDLDLTTADGAAAFDRRVNTVARQACLRTGSRLADGQCLVRFQREAMSQLPAPARDDYARARGGRVLAQVLLVYG